MADDTRPYGPLTPYIGVWTGTGTDVVPKKGGGSIVTPFIQQLTFEAVPILTYDGGTQTVRAVRYSCRDWYVDNTQKPAPMFPVYEENGYYFWLQAANAVMLQLSNPRGFSALAYGLAAPDDSFTVTTKGGGNGRGILVATSMIPFANVVAYDTGVKLGSDGVLLYANDTQLKLADGKIFNQTDITKLKRYTG